MTHGIATLEDIVHATAIVFVIIRYATSVASTHNTHTIQRQQAKVPLERVDEKLTSVEIRYIDSYARHTEAAFTPPRSSTANVLLTRIMSENACAPSSSISFSVTVTVTSETTQPTHHTSKIDRHETSVSR